MTEERFEELFDNVKVTKLETLEEYKQRVKDAFNEHLLDAFKMLPFMRKPLLAFRKELD